MKYNVLGIEHRCGSFTATAGKDVGKEISYDYYRLHCIKKSRENIGGVAVVPVRCSVDLFGQLVAECGGKPEDILNRKIDFEVKDYHGSETLKDFEVIE